MSDLREKYFRYRRYGRQKEWLYAYIDGDDNGVSFNSDIERARPLSMNEIQCAFNSIELKHGSIQPEQMTEEEFLVVKVIDS